MQVTKFQYNGQEIDFVPAGTTNVMVNATEMAQAFGRRTEDFLKTSNTKSFIDVMEKQINHPLNRGRIIENRGRNGIYFHRILALKFAAWLNPEFELWVYKTIDQILFGSYIEFRRAEKQKLETQMKLQQKTDELINQYPELKDFFELKSELRNESNRSVNAFRAVKNQLRMEFFENK